MAKIMDTNKISISSRRDSYGNRLIIDQRGEFSKETVVLRRWERLVKGVTLETLAFKHFTVANLRFQLS